MCVYKSIKYKYKNIYIYIYIYIRIYILCACVCVALPGGASAAEKARVAPVSGRIPPGCPPPIFQKPGVAISSASGGSALPSVSADRTCQHASAYVSIRQHTSAYASGGSALPSVSAERTCQHASAYVSIRQHTLAAAARCLACPLTAPV